MGKAKKLLIVGLLVVVVGGIYFYTSKSGGQLFKGQLVLDNKETAAPAEETNLPDLQAKIELDKTSTDTKNLNVTATISNTGSTAITGEIPYKYAIFVNGNEVFSNTDSYSTIEAGDSFSFNYTINKELYNYENSGTVKLVVDTGNKINETNESNNESEIAYQANN